MPSISERPLISGQTSTDELAGVKGLRETYGQDGEGWKVTLFETTPKVNGVWLIDGVDQLRRDEL